MTRQRLAAAAGPVLIVAAVLVSLRDFAFAGMLSNQHVDPLAFWLPTHCFLGSSLAAGHIPAWNPHVMGGAPFAADPQSGWMYLPAMALYSTLSCGTALRWFIVLQPLIAGLALYAFLRTEGLSRPAATVGGLALALPIAGSRIGLSLPFAGALAWTAVALLCAARLLRAERWSARLGWTAALAVAWGQIAAAHLSHGLALGTGALAVYLAARIAADVRSGRRTGREAAALVALVVGSLPLVNLAFLLPRLAYFPRTTLALGYDGLEAAAAGIAGRAPDPFRPGAGVGPGWLLAFGLSPGAYLGAGPLAVAFAGWWSRRHRTLVIAFSSYALGCAVLSLRSVAGALRHVPGVPVQYLHEPARLRYGVVLALPILAAAGIEAWRHGGGWRRRAAMLAPGLLLWLALPAALGVSLARLTLPLLGIVASGGALVAATVRPALLAILPAVLAVELTANAIAGQAHRRQFVPTGTADPGLIEGFPPMTEPSVPTAAYLRPGPIARTLLEHPGARFLAHAPGLLGERGYLERQRPQDWPLLANQRGALFGLEDAQGYNPAQLPWYWRFIRIHDSRGIKYNAAVLVDIPPQALDLLGVGWVVAPIGTPPEEGAREVAREGAYALYRRVAMPTRASFHPDWTLAQDDLSAGVPAGEPGGAAATARFRWTGPGAARVEVAAPGAGIVLVRNVWDPGWRARVDTRPAEVLRADGFLQAVAVPAGRHVIDLRYEDPTIGRGVLGSGLVLVALSFAAFALRRRERAP